MERVTIPNLSRSVGGIRAPDTVVAREAVELAATSSSPMLLNHVMRSYYLGRAIAGAAGDDETIFLATTLHDLGLTDAARGPRRFELEGADAARVFLGDRRFDARRGWLVWDIIALHPWGDINLYKEPEARVAQLGIMADATGMGLDAVEPQVLAEILAAYPRLNFKSGFVDLLMHEARTKPEAHAIHPVHMIAHHCCHAVAIPDARAIIAAAPFDE